MTLLCIAWKKPRVAPQPRSSIVFGARVHCFVVWCIVFSANQRRPCKSCYAQLSTLAWAACGVLGNFCTLCMVVAFLLVNSGSKSVSPPHRRYGFSRTPTNKRTSRKKHKNKNKNKNRKKQKHFLCILSK